jgi:hypothetical protein
MKKRVTIFLAVLFCTAITPSESFQSLDQPNSVSPVTVFNAPTNNAPAKIPLYERIYQTLEVIQSMTVEEIKHPKHAEQFIAVSDELREGTIQKIDISEQLEQSEIESLYQTILQYAELNSEVIKELFQAGLEEGGMAAVTDLILIKISIESTLSIVENIEYRKQFIDHMLITPLFVLLPSSVQIKLKEQIEFEDFVNNNDVGQQSDQYSLINKTLRMNRFIQKFDKQYQEVVTLIIRPYMIKNQEGS